MARKGTLIPFLERGSSQTGDENALCVWVLLHLLLEITAVLSDAQSWSD